MKEETPKQSAKKPENKQPEGGEVKLEVNSEKIAEAVSGAAVDVMQKTYDQCTVENATAFYNGLLSADQKLKENGIDSGAIATGIGH